VRVRIGEPATHAAVTAEAVWLAKQKSPRTRRAYTADVQHLMRFCRIAAPEQLR
jgi:hypothetical protein